MGVLGKPAEVVQSITGCTGPVRLEVLGLLAVRWSVPLGLGHSCISTKTVVITPVRHR